MGLDFKIKLLSENKAVLVELNGFESEVFVPVIRNNHITFENAIQSRCFPKPNLSDLQKVLSTSVNTSDRTSSSIHGDLEFSPPDKIRRCRQVVSHSPVIEIQNNILRTPIKNLSLKNENYKMKNLYKKQTEKSTKNLVELESQKNNYFCEMETRPNVEILHNELILYPESNFITPVCKENIKTYSKEKKKKTEKINLMPQTITKWRKCITPIKTYSRRQFVTNKNSGKCNQPPTPRIIPIENITLPDYIRNSTDGIDGDALLIVKKNKLLRDTNIVISPRKFKKQLTEVDNLESEKLFLPKAKIDFKNSISGRPYELLTNLYRYQNISHKLTEMFKKRCIKKVCSPRPRYLKLIGKVPDLENKINNRMNKLNNLVPRKLII